MGKVVTVLGLVLVLARPAFAEEAMDKALAELGLKAEQIQIHAADLAYFYGTEMKPPVFQSLQAEPLRSPLFAQTFREFTLKNSTRPYQITWSALHHVGLGVRRSLGGDPLTDLEKRSQKKLALVDAIAALPGEKLSGDRRRELEKRVKALPPELASVAAYLVFAQGEAIKWRNRAFAKIPTTTLKAAYQERLQPLRQEVAVDLEGVGPLTRRLLSDVDRQALAIGALDLVWAVEKAIPLLQKAPLAKGGFTWATSLGEIVIGASGPSTYKARKSYLLIIDQEGNDTYLTGGGTSWKHPVSLLFDLKGDDRYLGAPSLEEQKIGAQKERNRAGVVPEFGAGVFGYGVLVDLEGNDLYRAHRFTQGRGDFGVGILWDRLGDDRYDCYAQCQASAEVGTGLLVDGEGVDRYSTFQQAQGFGGPGGSGFLFDFGEGGDQYLANSTQIDFPSLVDKKFNINLAQGVACGFRSDVIDGYSLSGGFGVLLDGGGDNQYEAGFFAQGFAYWYGVGLLSAGSGADIYKAGKYALGSSAHFGIGVLHEGGGSDRYRVEQELGLGHGHDFGIGYFVDEAGDDQYEAPNLALGCASAQGMGFFWDRGGSDSYSSSAKAILGCASPRVEPPSMRFAARTLGVFVDSGDGKNSLKTPIVEGAYSSSKKWRTPVEGSPESIEADLKARLLGVGLLVK